MRKIQANDPSEKRPELTKPGGRRLRICGRTHLTQIGGFSFTVSCEEAAGARIDLGQAESTDEAYSDGDKGSENQSGRA